MKISIAMKKIPLYLLVLMLISSCSTLKVSQEFDKSIDFTKYKTFSIHTWNDENSALINRFDQERLISALADQLKKRGYTQVNQDGDIEADIFLILDRKQSTTAYSSYYGGGYWSGYGYGFGYGYYPGYGATNYQTEVYVEGTLIVNLFDRTLKKLVWQGTGLGTIDQDPQTREKGIPKAMDQIFWKYPVRKK